ncbi:hypothetical protein DV736_g1098, partial [Chaetothyriales sp. CBS 134916]
MSATPQPLVIQPGRSLGWITLGSSLHSVISRLKAQPDLYPRFDLAYSSTRPLHEAVIATVPSNGLRLRFDGPDQRLRLIEVYDFSKASMTYHNIEVVRKPRTSDDPAAPEPPVLGPSFRHVYRRLVGPAYEGEYIAPSPGHSTGTYVLSYPGLAFSFPIQHKSWSAKADFVRMLDSAAAGPAKSLAIFSGPSWPEARPSLFTATPPYPRSTALIGRLAENTPDEVDEVRLYSAGKVEFVRRSSPPVMLQLGESTSQDLVAEFGPPDAVYRKHDNRLSIHAAASSSGRRPPSVSPGLDPHAAVETDQRSNQSYTDSSDAEMSIVRTQNEAQTACFYNYFHHGFDALVSHPEPRSPAFPGQELAASSDNQSSQPVVTKILLHGNVPGSYVFNRHRRSRWKIIHTSNPNSDQLNSETLFSDLRLRLGGLWQELYENEEEQKKMQRAMVLNRGWDESPDSSIELLGGFEDGYEPAIQNARTSSESATELNNTDLYGFPGMLFEILKNDAISCLTTAKDAAKFLKSTLRLPASSFPPRPVPADLAKYLPRCSDDVYAWQRQHRPLESTFRLHDGPPYANGELHVGHALNKILKDTICRTKLGQGRRVDYVPGWDCHGLPIELKVLEKHGWKRGHDVEPTAIRKAARSFAQKTVDKQMAGFRSWGVMGDWQNHWKTMDKDFEIRQLHLFQSMVKNSLIYRKNKPVYWSPSSATALAEAELEYDENHSSHSAYVKFPLSNFGTYSEPVYALIWTTTPWTLPANQAIAINRALQYALVRSANHGLLIVASSRLDTLNVVLGDRLEVIVQNIDVSALLEATYDGLPHFGEQALHRPIVDADFVSAHNGTGLVHCAPGHGMEDYVALQPLIQSGRISIRAPVDALGCFDNEASLSEPELLKGKHVFGDGNQAVLALIANQGRLAHSHTYTHKYPIDWRTKEPLMIRATAQWFADLSSIRPDAVDAIENVKFVPESGKARLRSFVEGRTEWCISRQRAWGVPIPALYHVDTGEAVLTEASVQHIIRVIEERGIDAWWSDAPDDSVWIPSNLNSTEYRRGTDTMDVWFDSGTSWTGMLAADVESVGKPLADIYIEGTDQHRGWFQSSLLTHVAYQPSSAFSQKSQAPFASLLTHGFTLDANGKKMSKSIGNVISPDEIIKGLSATKEGSQSDKSKKFQKHSLGPDALRLWVASGDWTTDVVIGETVVKTVHAALDKYRITFKMLLGMLKDFDTSIAVPYNDLSPLDRIALHQLAQASNAIQQAYAAFEFHKVVTIINRYVVADLSGFYFEAIKDISYCDSPSDPRRISLCTTLHHILSHLQCMLAPITPLLVQEVWEHSDEQSRGLEPSKRVFPKTPSEWTSAEYQQLLPNIMAVNSRVKQAQEEARAEKLLGQSLASDVFIYASHSMGLSKLPTDTWKEIFVVSDCAIQEGHDLAERDDDLIKHFGLQDRSWHRIAEIREPDRPLLARVVVTSPAKNKCVRCWRYVAEPAPETELALCGRCTSVVEEFKA